MDTRQKSEVVFKEFLELVNKLTSHDKEIHRRLQRSYDRTNPHFRWSRGFINLVTLCGDKIRATPEKRLLHIKEFIEELSNYKAKPLKHLLENASCVSDSDGSSEEEERPKQQICTKEIIRVDDVEALSRVNDCEQAEGLVTRKNGIADKRGEKRKLCGDLEPDLLSTTDILDAENRKKKICFYNSSVVPKASDVSVSNIGYSKRKNNESQSVSLEVNDNDVICLDDDDDDETCATGQSDLGDDRMAEHKTQNSSASNAANMETSIISFHKSEPKPGVQSSGRSAGIRTENNSKMLKANANTLVPREDEVICLDDDDDDNEAASNHGIGEKGCLKSLLNYRFPVQKLINTSKFMSLPSKAVVDLGIIEIMDTDDKQCETPPLQETSGQTVQAETDHKGATNSEVVESSRNSHSLVDTVMKSTVSAAIVSQEVIHGTCDQVNTEKSVDCSDKDIVGNDSEREVKHLQKLLHKLSKEIKSLEQTELTLDDMDSAESFFIQEAELKNEFMETWKKLCDITHCPAVTGRPSEKRLAIEIPDYPDIGREICEFINQKTDFIDYQDILEVVQPCKSKYHLSEDIVRSLSEKIFLSVGKRLQQLRKMELAENMNSYLPDNVRSYDDPAMYDQNLCQKLDGNQVIGNRKLEEIFKTFGERQDLEGDKTASEEEDDDDDEYNDGNGEAEDEAEVASHVEPSSHVEILSTVEPLSDVEFVRSVVDAAEDSTSEGESVDDFKDDSAEMNHKNEILIIRFDDDLKLPNSLEARSVVTSDKRQKQNSELKVEEPLTVANDNQDSFERKTPDGPQLKIRSDLLDNIRRLATNMNFSPTTMSRDEGDGKNDRYKVDNVRKEDSADSISGGISKPQNISEVEIAEVSAITSILQVEAVETCLSEEHSQRQCYSEISTSQVDSNGNVENQKELSELHVSQKSSDIELELSYESEERTVEQLKSNRNVSVSSLSPAVCDKSAINAETFGSFVFSAVQDETIASLSNTTPLFPKDITEPSLKSKTANCVVQLMPSDHDITMKMNADKMASETTQLALPEVSFVPDDVPLLKSKISADNDGTEIRAHICVVPEVEFANSAATEMPLSGEGGSVNMPVGLAGPASPVVASDSLSVSLDSSKVNVMNVISDGFCSSPELKLHLESSAESTKTPPENRVSGVTLAFDSKKPSENASDYDISLGLLGKLREACAKESKANCLLNQDNNHLKDIGKEVVVVLSEEDNSDEQKQSFRQNDLCSVNISE